MRKAEEKNCMCKVIMYELLPTSAYQGFRAGSISCARACISDRESGSWHCALNPTIVWISHHNEGERSITCWSIVNLLSKITDRN